MTINQLIKILESYPGDYKVEVEDHYLQESFGIDEESFFILDEDKTLMIYPL